MHFTRSDLAKMAEDKCPNCKTSDLNFGEVSIEGNGDLALREAECPVCGLRVQLRYYLESVLVIDPPEEVHRCPSVG